MAEAREQNRKLHAAKTANEANEALKPRDEIARFNAALAVANEAFGDLSRPVRRAIYENFGNGDFYRPEDPYEAEEAEKARKNDLLTYDEDAGGYEPNYSDPSVGKAFEAVEEVFSSDWKGDLEDWFRSHYKKNFVARSQAVWEALNLM